MMNEQLNDEFADIINGFCVPTSGDSVDKLQQNEEWFKQRLGMFTSSKFNDVIALGRGGNSMGKRALTYMQQVISERMLSDSGKDEYVANLMAAKSRPTNWGNDYEPWARDEFTKLTGLEVKEVGFLTHPKFNFWGGSSDGEVVATNGGKAIVEIKNPYDCAKHIANVKICSSDSYPPEGDHYAQMQSNIAVSGAEGCFFVSGDVRSFIPIAWIYVPRDEEFIKHLEDRVNALNEAVLTEIDELNNINF